MRKLFFLLLLFPLFSFFVVATPNGFILLDEFNDGSLDTNIWDHYEEAGGTHTLTEIEHLRMSTTGVTNPADVNQVIYLKLSQPRDLRNHTYALDWSQFFADRDGAGGNGAYIAVVDESNLTKVLTGDSAYSVGKMILGNNTDNFNQTYSNVTLGYDSLNNEIYAAYDGGQNRQSAAYLNESQEWVLVFVSFSRTNSNNIGTVFASNFSYSSSGENFLLLAAKDGINSSSIYNFNITFSNGSFFSTSLGFINLENWTNGNYTVEFRANNFLSRNYSFEHINVSSVQAELFPANKLNVNIFNGDTGAVLSQLVEITAQNSTGQSLFNTSAGSIVLELNPNTPHTLIFESENFTASQYDIEMSPNEVFNGLNAYLFPNATAVTVTVKDTSGDAINGVNIRISTYVNNSLDTIAQKNTDVLGRATFNLILDRNYIFNISKSGFQTQVSEIELTETSLVFTLLPETGVNLDGPTTGVFYRYRPTNISLHPDEVTFSWQIVTQENNIENFGFIIFNGSNQIAQVSSSNMTGGNITITLNLSAYINSSIIVRYFFKKQGFDTFTLPIIYLIRSSQSVGQTAGDARAFAQNNLPIWLRVTLWVISVLIIILMLVMIKVTSIKNIYISLLLSFAPAWYLAIEIAPIGAIIAIGIMSFYGQRREF